MKWNNLIYGILFSGLGAFSYFLLVDYTNLSPHIADALYSRGAFIYFILAFNVLGYATLRLSSWINTQYAVNMRSRWKIPIIYLAGMSLFLLLNYGLLVSAKILAGAANPFSIQPRGWWMLITIWLVELVVLGLLLANRSTQKALRLQQRAAVLQAENDTARYTALQNQLNPHFLFNTLNSLYSLLIGTSERAETAFVKFIELVRYTYTGVDRDTVAIGDEIRYIGNYIDLQSLRLNSHTKVEWTHEVDDEKAPIPPMIMMTFLENVFKYGVSAHRDCLIRIRLTLKDGLLEFYTENDIVKRVDEFRSEAPVGLENCRGRLTSLFPDAWELLTEERDGKFIVNLKIRLS